MAHLKHHQLHEAFLGWPPGNQAPLLQHPPSPVLGSHYMSGLSFGNTDCLRQEMCLILLLDPVVQGLVHIWCTTYSDGRELKQHE